MKPDEGSVPHGAVWAYGYAFVPPIARDHLAILMGNHVYCVWRLLEIWKVSGSAAAPRIPPPG
jgi:hypothetical protein